MTEGNKGPLLVEVTPALAQALLKVNVPYEIGKAGTNRPVNPKTVAKYAAAMLAGEWVESNQGIGLIGMPPNERLGDGQHRLLAVLLAAETDPNIAVPMWVFYGLPDESVSVVDTGKARLAGEVLSMKFGTKSSMNLAAALRLLYSFDNIPYDYTTWRALRLSHSTIESLYAKNEEALKVAVEDGRRIQHVMSTTSAIFLMFALRRARPDIDPEPFMYGVATGADLSERSPLLGLRNACLNKARLGQRRDAVILAAMGIKSFNLWVVDDRKDIIRFTSAETFPQVTSKAWVTR